MKSAFGGKTFKEIMSKREHYKYQHVLQTGFPTTTRVHTTLKLFHVLTLYHLISYERLSELKG